MVCIIHFPMQDFQTIAHLIPNLADRVNNPPAPAREQALVSQVFKDMLGQSVAFIQPVLFRSGQLVVYAEAAVWGQHIRHRETSLLEQCRAAGVRVSEITVKIQADAHAAQRTQARRPATYNVEAASQNVEKLAAHTSQDELKKSLKRLATRIRDNHDGEQ